jgi:hypothetical protein
MQVDAFPFWRGSEAAKPPTERLSGNVVMTSIECLGFSKK